MLVFHSFGDFPTAVAPFLKDKNTVTLELQDAFTIVPAEKRMFVGEEMHWGFQNKKPAKTFVMIHKIDTT